MPRPAPAPQPEAPAGRNAPRRPRPAGAVYLRFPLRPETRQALQALAAARGLTMATFLRGVAEREVERAAARAAGKTPEKSRKIPD